MITLLTALSTIQGAGGAEPVAAPGAPPGDPATLAVRYVVEFDLDPRADQVCGVTKVCDCTMAYAGTGAKPRRGNGEITFTGTWTSVGNTCHEVFTLWVPADGAAHHTLRLGADGTTIVGWLAHRDPGTTRMASDFKKHGQVFLEPLSLATNVGAPMVHTEKDTQVLSGLSVSSTHTLTLTLAR